MTRRNLMVTTVRPVLVLVLVLVASCTKHDSLVLLELRSSGPLGAPVASIRLSASGWPTRTVAGSIGPEGFRVGYYGPGDGKALTVRAEALDAADCVLGIGSAGVTALAAGAISAPTTLFVRPQPGQRLRRRGHRRHRRRRVRRRRVRRRRVRRRRHRHRRGRRGRRCRRRRAPPMPMPTTTPPADAGMDADDDARTRRSRTLIQSPRPAQRPLPDPLAQAGEGGQTIARRLPAPPFSPNLFRDEVDLDRRRGLPRAARLPHGQSVRAPGRSVRRRPDRAMDRHRQLPRSRLPEPRGGHLLRPDAEHGAPAAARADQQRLVLVPDLRPGPGHHAVHVPVRHAGDRHRPRHLRRRRDYAALLATGARQHRHLGELPLPLLGHLPVRPGRRVDAAGNPFGRRRSDGICGLAGSPSRTSRASTTATSAAGAATIIASEPSGGASAGAGARRARCSRTSPAQADPVAGRRLRLGRHDDGVGPQPRRDLGSGRPAHRHADANDDN